VDRSVVHFIKTHRKHSGWTTLIRTFWQRSMRFWQLNSGMSRCRRHSARAWHSPVHTTEVCTQCKTLSVLFNVLQIYYYTYADCSVISIQLIIAVTTYMQDRM